MALPSGGTPARPGFAGTYGVKESKEVESAAKAAAKALVTLESDLTDVAGATEKTTQSHRSLFSALRAGVIGFTGLGAVLTQTQKHFSPAAYHILQLRLGDLAAVVGQILHPAFVKLSDFIYGFSRFLYNLSPTMKNVIAWTVGLGVPLIGLAVVFGTVGFSVYTLMGAANIAAIGIQAAAARITAAGLSTGISGIFGWFGGLGRLGALAGKLGLFAVAVAGTVGILDHFFGGGSLRKRLMKDMFGGPKDPTGMDADRKVTTLDSVLQAGQMFRETALRDTSNEKENLQREQIEATKDLTKAILKKGFDEGQSGKQIVDALIAAKSKQAIQ